MKPLTLNAFLIRLIVLCVLPLLLLVISLAAYHVYAVQSQHDREAADRVQEIATMIDRRLEAQIAALQVLAYSPLADSAAGLSGLYREALGYRESLGGHVVLADLSLQMLFNTRVPFGTSLPKLPKPRGFAAAPAALATGKPAVGDAFPGPIAKEPLIAVAVPVVRYGKIKALLLNIIAISHFQQSLDKVSLPDGWSVTIRDGGQEVIARRGSSGPESSPATESSIGRFAAVSSVSHWSVELTIPRSIYFSPILAASATLAVAILTFTLVSILGGRLASRRLARSVALLTGRPSREQEASDIVEIDEVRQRLEYAAEAIHESETRFRAIFEQAAVGMALVSPDGRWLQINQKLCDIVGTSREALLAGTFRDVIVSDAPASDGNAVQQIMDGKAATRSLEKYLARTDQSGVWINLTLGPMHASDGTLSAFVCVLEEITERKEAEQKLSQSEAEYRRLSREFQGLLDAIPDSIMLLDKDLNVLWANKSTEDETGTQLGNLTGVRCSTLWYQNAKPCDPCPVLKTFESGKLLSETVTMPDNRIWDIRTVPLVDDEGNAERVISVKRDITEHRKLEAQYLQAQKMESIGILAGGIAHDFNNILSAIMGFAHVALITMKKGDPQRQHIEDILESADRAARLTKDLLLFSRKEVIAHRPIDLNKVITKVQGFLKRVIGEDITCTATVCTEPLTILADTNQLEQILMNFATNARDAMIAGGSFSITTNLATLGEDFIDAHGYGSPGTYALVTVSDTGKGMDEETRSHIFEPFYTTKEVGKGTGLGLAVVYGIIKQHEGFVHVYSEPGKGTTFKIYLPVIAPDTVEESKNYSAEVPVGGTETLLIAEDDETLRKLTTQIVRQFGYSVIEASDGEDALHKYRENRDSISLVLLDLIMPKMNGKEVFDEIRKIRPDMNVIFASGYAPDIIRDKLSLTGTHELIYKPFSPFELLRTIRSVLDRA